MAEDNPQFDTAEQTASSDDQLVHTLEEQFQDYYFRDQSFHYPLNIHSLLCAAGNRWEPVSCLIQYQFTDRAFSHG